MGSMLATLPHGGGDLLWTHVNVLVKGKFFLYFGNLCNVVAIYILCNFVCGVNRIKSAWYWSTMTHCCCVSFCSALIYIDLPLLHLNTILWEAVLLKNKV